MQSCQGRAALHQVREIVDGPCDGGRGAAVASLGFGITVVLVVAVRHCVGALAQVWPSQALIQVREADPVAPPLRKRMRRTRRVALVHEGFFYSVSGRE